MSDTIDVVCRCGRRIVAPKDLAGQAAKCRGCGSSFNFPSLAPVVIAPAAPADPRPVKTLDREPWFYAVIVGLGWIAIAIGSMLLGLFPIVFVPMARRETNLGGLELWVTLGGGISFWSAALGALALVDLLRNVRRILHKAAG